MAKKKQTPAKKAKGTSAPVFGLKAEVMEQPITSTLYDNYMPYAMSVIVSRAIPEIDGFKPSHRKLLYTMYKMGLLSGNRTKSANIVGQTMKLNPHGDAAIYETMVRLARGHDALLHPFVDSKGNFGKHYSRNMMYAASRYTEARLEPICAEIFRDLDNDAVDFMDNYDGSMKEPMLLPTTFPNVLVAMNQGIAVGMASNLCGFNLREVCETTIAVMKNPKHDLLSTLKGPDFPTGGELLYDENALREIYATGRGSVKVRARWRYVKEENLIEVFEIPYSTTIEAIMDKVAELIKVNKIREIADMRDETDLDGLKLTIDLKRGTDPDKLMAKLFQMTPLQDSFACNFNILIAGNPMVLGVGSIIDEWVAWRTECVKRRVHFVLKKKQEKLHLLKGLGKILLDIDRAIRIIRETDEDAEVIPNLMIGFGIDAVQAEYVADIRLRNINKEYLLKRTNETKALEEEIADLTDVLANQKRVYDIIIGELKDAAKKYGGDRRTEVIYEDEVVFESVADETPDYPVHLFLSQEGYLKKITPQSLRMSGEQKYKEGDGAWCYWETTNRDELLVFTSQCQCYKARLSDFEDSKASLLGDYLPSKLDMEPDETVIFVAPAGDYKAHLLFFFQNGKVARVPVSAYETQTKRKKLTGAMSDKSPFAAGLVLADDREATVFSTEGRAVVFHTAALSPKTTRNTQGVNVMTIKPKYKLEKAQFLEETQISNPARFRARSLPATGSLVRVEDLGGGQMELL